MTINFISLGLVLTICLERVLSLDTPALTKYTESDTKKSHWLDSSDNSFSMSYPERRLSDIQDYPFFYIGEETTLSITHTLAFRSVLIEDSSRNLLIVYEDKDPNPDRVYGKVLTPDLSEYESLLQISSDTHPSVKRPDGCLLSDGKIIIVWVYGDIGSRFQLYGKILNPDYSEFLAEFEISETENYDDNLSSIDCFPSGNFVVSWSKTTDFKDIYYKIYDSVGNSLINETKANDIDERDQKHSKVACFSDNSFVIVWINAEITDQENIKAKIFDTNGNTLISEFEVSDSVDMGYKFMDTFVLSDTKFVTTWFEIDSNSNFYYHYRRIFDYRGNPLEDKFLINDPSSLMERMPVGTRLEDGGFVIAWKKRISSINTIRAQRFDEDGNKIDGEITLSSSSIDTDFPAITKLKNGGYATTWNKSSDTQRYIYLSTAEPCESINCRDCSSGKDNCSLYKDGSGSNNDTSDSSDVCTSCDYSCHPSCETCFGSSESECSSCKHFLQLNNGLCLCQDGRKPSSSVECDCPSSSFDTGSDPIECSSCALYCQSCLSQDSCLSCEEGFFVENGGCKRCEDNCKRCSGEKECLECDDTFDLEEGECECALYYVLEPTNDQTNMCVYRTLSFSFSSSYDLVFDKDLSDPLTLYNIQYSFFLPSLRNFTFEVSSSSLSEYSLRISSQIPSDSSHIRFKLRGVFGEDGSTIREEEREVTADVFYIDEPEKKDEEEIIPSAIPITINTASTVSAGTGVGGSIGISLLSMQPSALWSFLNIAILVYLSPLQNIGAPEAFKNFTHAFGGNFWDIVPNLGEILKIEEQSNKSDLLQDYDIVSSSVLINSGVALFVFCIGICILPVLIFLYILSCMFGNCCSKFLLKKIKHYRWDFLIRSLIQLYTEIMFFSLVSLKSSSFLSVDYILSGIFVFFGVSIIFLLTLTTIIYRKKIEEGEYGNFKSFFEEFETKRGLMVSLFYPFFFLRRLLFCLGLHFLSEYSFIQVILNSSANIVFICYLIACRPFKNRSIFVLNVISEIFLGAFFISSGCFLLDLSDNAVLIICQLCVLLITMIPVISILIFSVTGIHRCFRKKTQSKVYSLRDIENETIVFQRSPRKRLDV